VLLSRPSRSLLLKISGATGLNEDIAVVAVKILANLIKKHGKQLLLALKNSPDPHALETLASHLTMQVQKNTHDDLMSDEILMTIMQFVLLNETVTATLMDFTTNGVSILHAVLELLAQVGQLGSLKKKPQLAETTLQVCFKLLSSDIIDRRKLSEFWSPSFMPTLFLNVTDGFLQEETLSIMELKQLRWLLSSVSYMLLDQHKRTDSMAVMLLNALGFPIASDTQSEEPNDSARLLSIFSLIERSDYEHNEKPAALQDNMDMEMGQPMLALPSGQENQSEDAITRHSVQKKAAAKVAETKKLVPVVYQSWAELVSFASTFFEGGLDLRWDEYQLVLINTMLGFLQRTVEGRKTVHVARATAYLMKKKKTLSVDECKLILGNILDAIVASTWGTRIWLYEAFLDYIRICHQVMVAAGEDMMLRKQAQYVNQETLRTLREAADFWRTVGKDVEGQSPGLELSLRVLEIGIDGGVFGGIRLVKSLMIMPVLYDEVKELTKLLARDGGRTKNKDPNSRLLSILSFLTNLCCEPEGLMFVVDELDFLEILISMACLVGDRGTHLELFAAVVQFFSTCCRVGPHNTLIHHKTSMLLNDACEVFKQILTVSPSSSLKKIQACSTALTLICSLRESAFQETPLQQMGSQRLDQIQSEFANKVGNIFKIAAQVLSSQGPKDVKRDLKQRLAVWTELLYLTTDWANSYYDFNSETWKAGFQFLGSCDVSNVKDRKLLAVAAENLIVVVKRCKIKGISELDSKLELTNLTHLRNQAQEKSEPQLALVGGSTANRSITSNLF